MPLITRRLAPLVALLSLLLGPAIHAAERAGELMMVRGEVTAVAPGGDIRPLEKGDFVHSGETLATGPNSSVRVRFSDGGFMFLRPGSRMRIDEYRHRGEPKGDRSAFSLLKGGFRSITGAIGHANKENYRIDTPVATIGIRGTDHQGRYCNGDCIDLMNQGVQPPADGLYTGTTSGATSVGGRVFRAGQFGYTSPQRQTIELPEPPPILVVDGMPDPSAGAGAGGEDEGGDQEPGGGGGGEPGGDDPAGGGDQGGAGSEGGGDAGGDGSGTDIGGNGRASGGDGGDAPEEFEIPPRSGPPVSTDCVR